MESVVYLSMRDITLNFKYRFPEEYNPVYVNGAHGGVTPNGELVINFYFERQPLPYEEKMGFNEDGSFNGNVVVEPEEHNLNIIRFVQTGVILNTDTARTIHEWLGNHLEALDQVQREGE